MSRIDEVFGRIRKGGRKGFIPFVTAGDPDLETSVEVVIKLAELGADIVEIGVPFSDPVADGPTIQRSSTRAIQSGTSIFDVLHLAGSIKKRADIPIVLFTYLNPLMRLGVEELCWHSDVIDGVLITDVIDEEAFVIAEKLALSGIDLISLVAPTTSDKRLERICREARGFIYAISRAGVTGVRDKTGCEARTLVERIRHYTEKPVAVGFGISNSKQIQDVWEYADAAVVGSAIVAEIEKADSPEDALLRVETMISSLLPEFAKTDIET